MSRLAQPVFGAVSGYYAQQNSGKRNLSIDLNVPEARVVVLKLCETADIIVENFRPGTLASFGLDYDAIAAHNLGVVYASISGYGQKGSWRNRMAYAPSIQAEAGFTVNTHRQFSVGEEQPSNRRAFTRRRVLRPARHDRCARRAQPPQRHR